MNLSSLWPFRRKTPVRPWEAVQEALGLVRAAHPHVRLWTNGVNYQGIQIAIVPQRATDGFRSDAPSVFLATVVHERQDRRFPRYLSAHEVQSAVANARMLQEANDHVHVRGGMLTNAPEADFVKLPPSVRRLEAPDWTPEQIADVLLAWVGE
jgi:hypothetical protein